LEQLFNFHYGLCISGFESKGYLRAAGTCFFLVVSL